MKLSKYLIINVMFGREKIFPKEYRMKDKWCLLTHKDTPCLGLKKHIVNDPEMLKKSQNLDACVTIINEKLGLDHYLQSCMEFQVLSQMMIKSRHRL